MLSYSGFWAPNSFMEFRPRLVLRSYLANMPTAGLPIALILWDQYLKPKLLRDLQAWSFVLCSFQIRERLLPYFHFYNFRRPAQVKDNLQWAVEKTVDRGGVYLRPEFQSSQSQFFVQTNLRNWRSPQNRRECNSPVPLCSAFERSEENVSAIIINVHHDDDWKTYRGS